MYAGSRSGFVAVGVRPDPQPATVPPTDPPGPRPPLDTPSTLPPLRQRVTRYDHYRLRARLSLPFTGTWTAYNATDRPTMVIDNESKLVNDPIREQRLVMFRALEYA